MVMKLAIVAGSLGALACALIVWLNGVWLTGDEGVIYLAGLFALAVGILSAVNAGHLRHRSWTALWALLTVGGGVAYCGGYLNEGFSSPSWAGSLAPEAPDIVQASHLVMLAPVVVIVLAAVLSALLLRPSAPEPAKSVDPPAGTA